MSNITNVLKKRFAQSTLQKSDLKKIRGGKMSKEMKKMMKEAKKLADKLCKAAIKAEKEAAKREKREARINGNGDGVW